MKLLIIFLAVIATFSTVCYGAKECYLKANCFFFWQADKDNILEIPPDCKAEIVTEEYYNKSMDELTGKPRDDLIFKSRQLNTKMTCNEGKGNHLCSKITFELKNSKNDWQSFLLAACKLEDKIKGQSNGYSLGCSYLGNNILPWKTQIRNKRICLCDSDLCNDEKLGGAGEIRSLSFTANIIIVGFLSLISSVF